MFVQFWSWLENRRQSQKNKTIFYREMSSSIPYSVAFSYCCSIKENGALHLLGHTIDGIIHTRESQCLAENHLF